MRPQFLFACIGVGLSSLGAVAQVLDLTPWKDISSVVEADRRDRARVYVPDNLKPVSSKEGLLGQMLDYQLHRSTLDAAATRISNTGFEARSSGNPADKESPQTFFQLKPIESKGVIGYESKVKATLTYQVWQRETDIQVNPEKILGLGFALSHVTTPIDSQNRILLVFDW
jgi:hypothetical protein